MDSNRSGAIQSGSNSDGYQEGVFQPWDPSNPFETMGQRKARWTASFGLPSMPDFRKIFTRSVPQDELTPPPPPPSPPRLPAFLENHPDSFVPASVENGIAENVADDNIDQDVECNDPGADNDRQDSASVLPDVNNGRQDAANARVEGETVERLLAADPPEDLVLLEDLGPDLECERQGADDVDATNTEEMVDNNSGSGDAFSNSGTPASVNDFDGFSAVPPPSTHPISEFVNYNFGSIHSDEQDPVADNSLLRSAGHSAAMEDANGAVLQEAHGSVLQDVTNRQQISQPPGSNIYQGLSQVSIYLFS